MPFINCLQIATVTFVSLSLASSCKVSQRFIIAFPFKAQFCPYFLTLCSNLETFLLCTRIIFLSLLVRVHFNWNPTCIKANEMMFSFSLSFVHLEKSSIFFSNEKREDFLSFFFVGAQTPFDCFYNGIKTFFSHWIGFAIFKVDLCVCARERTANGSL